MDHIARVLFFIFVLLLFLFFDFFLLFRHTPGLIIVVFSGGYDIKILAMAERRILCHTK